MGDSTVWRHLAAGALAGAAGTTALYIVTYLDQAARGRSPSRLPARTAEKLAGKAGIGFGDEERAPNREEAVGALLGILTGVGLGAAYGLLRTGVREVPEPVAGVGLGLAVTAGANTPMIALGLTDPRSWGAVGWLSDVIPHFTYGLVTAYAFRMMTPPARAGRCAAGRAGELIVRRFLSCRGRAR
ncbi:hypothetical protein Skr01_61370 [Sphaerisporangium krabiense]|uniref:DUF1440 domain-containing protein n=1 Tax=Sphaerisporangium krabiense TaxID=763782 RepID=A0A7W8Z2M8_9ACTN|nr:hypothetical protein [Sphaerisporangium krabiense]MBB5626284.1 hypothetical protein [Sphaerisporangium krabiense]GII66052.1 hypothetical protein Skr01_61370 [Sphaerisporangium krabiense]